MIKELKIAVYYTLGNNIFVIKIKLHKNYLYQNHFNRNVLEFSFRKGEQSKLEDMERGTQQKNCINV